MDGKRLACLVLLLLALCLSGCAGREDKTVLVLGKDESATPAEEASETVPEDPSLPLAGDWYGRWRMKNTSGDWTKAYGYSWDCCAEIRGDAEGNYTLLLWDEDLPKDNYLASAVISAGETLRCEGGSFMDRELEAGCWDLSLSEDAAGLLLIIRGDYDAVGEGGFHYDVYLRPWGSTWPGPAENQPYRYESWYLPLIEADSPMPDSIGK